MRTKNLINNISLNLLVSLLNFLILLITNNLLNLLFHYRVLHFNPAGVTEDGGEVDVVGLVPGGYCDHFDLRVVPHSDVDCCVGTPVELVSFVDLFAKGDFDFFEFGLWGVVE